MESISAFVLWFVAWVPKVEDVKACGQMFLAVKQEHSPYKLSPRRAAFARDEGDRQLGSVHPSSRPAPSASASQNLKLDLLTIAVFFHFLIFRGSFGLAILRISQESLRIAADKDALLVLLT